MGVGLAKVVSCVQFHFHLTTWESCSHTCAFVTKQCNLILAKSCSIMLCGWEGNRRSGVITLVMRHRLSSISTYRLNGLEREMSTSPSSSGV